MSSEAKPEFEAVSISTPCGVPKPPIVSRSVADRIADFLDGRTHGQDLLHELYDYVLEEPLPQRMREILR
jgi:4'-phosphopantetheinyl transferase EntD